MAGPWDHTFLTELADVEDLNECAGGHGPSSGVKVSDNRLSARRMHKADRERLRRDKLNEQFLELANALDPERPKNDKATILRESIQVVKELHEEVKKLKMERTSLLEESADLTQEKNELREEKASLKSETERLQSQVQQRLHSSCPWMAMDPSLMMSATPAYPYPMSVPQPVSLAPTDSNQVGGPCAPLVNPTPYMPMPPPVGSFQMHPSLQPYAMLSNRLGDGANPFMPFPGFPPTVMSHSHIERPYAQYPSSVQHPVPGYAIHVSPSKSSQSSPLSSSALYKPCVPGIPVIPAQHQASNTISKDSNDHPHTTQSSSSQHAPGEVEEENGRNLSADDAGFPLQQEVKEAAAQDSEVKNADLEVCEEGKTRSPSSSPCMVKEKLGFFLEKNGFPMIAKGQAKDLASCILEMEHDSKLRPPAA